MPLAVATPGGCRGHGHGGRHTGRHSSAAWCRRGNVLVLVPVPRVLGFRPGQPTFKGIRRCALLRATDPHRSSLYFRRELGCIEVALVGRDPPRPGCVIRLRLESPFGSPCGLPVRHLAHHMRQVQSPRLIAPIQRFVSWPGQFSDLQPSSLTLDSASGPFVSSSNWHLPQARAGFEVSWLVHVRGVQAVASPHSSCLADVSFGTTPPHRASMSLSAFVGSHGVQHRLDRVSMLRSCPCGTSWRSRHVWARSPVTW